MSTRSGSLANLAAALAQGPTEEERRVRLASTRRCGQWPQIATTLHYARVRPGSRLSALCRCAGVVGQNRARSKARCPRAHSSRAWWAG